MTENPRDRTSPLRLGEADVAITDPAHIAGISEGNSVGHYESMEGHCADGTSTALRSTGINPDAANPIMPESPNLSPA